MIAVEINPIPAVMIKAIVGVILVILSSEFKPPRWRILHRAQAGPLLRPSRGETRLRARSTIVPATNAGFTDALLFWFAGDDSEPDRQAGPRIGAPIEQALITTGGIGMTFPEAGVFGWRFGHLTQNQPRVAHRIEKITESPMKLIAGFTVILHLEWAGFGVGFFHLQPGEKVFPGPHERMYIIENVKSSGFEYSQHLPENLARIADPNKKSV